MLNQISVPASLAQESGTWQQPVQLIRGGANNSDESIHFVAPVMVADVWGTAHAFWESWRTSGPEGVVVDGSIFYARYDNFGWTEPVDIFHSNHRLWMPQVAVDYQGWLHFIWEGTGGFIMYTTASVMEAHNLHSWSTPEQLASSSRVRLGEAMKSMVATPEGDVHIVYCADDYIEHLHRTEQGQWSPPRIVQYSDFGNCGTINLALDETGSLHLVYTLSMGVETGSNIFYTRSDDNGQTWSNPFEIAAWRPDFDRGYGPSNPSIIAAGQEVHIVWLGFPRTQRWHRWSADQGQSWNKPSLVSPSPPMILRTNPPALILTSSGMLHMVSIAGLGQEAIEKVYYATWQNGAWSPLQEVYHEADERAALALTNGNVLHLIWDNDEGGARSIWATNKTLAESYQSPAEPPEPPPFREQASLTAATVASPVTTSLELKEEAAANNVTFDRNRPAVTSSPSSPFLLAFLVSCLVIIVGLFLGRK